MNDNMNKLNELLGVKEEKVSLDTMLGVDKSLESLLGINTEK